MFSKLSFLYVVIMITSSAFGDSFIDALQECRNIHLTRQTAIIRTKCLNNAKMEMAISSHYPADILEALKEYAALDEMTAMRYTKRRINKNEYIEKLRENNIAFSRDIEILQQNKQILIQQDESQKWSNFNTAIGRWAEQQQYIAAQNNQSNLNAMPFPQITTCSNYAGNQVRCITH